MTTDERMTKPEIRRAGIREAGWFAGTFARCQRTARPSRLGAPKVFEAEGCLNQFQRVYAFVRAASRDGLAVRFCREALAGVARDCHRNVRQGGSAHVLVRSDMRRRITVETRQRTWQTGACCARGGCTLHASLAMGVRARIGKGFRPKAHRREERAILSARWRGGLNPERVLATHFPLRAQKGGATTLSGLSPSLRRFPRVARSSQPWAGGHNPFGIEDTCVGGARAGALRGRYQDAPGQTGFAHFRLQFVTTQWRFNHS
jgi:hypothetical protein